jgi:hypothetical protein
MLAWSVPFSMNIVGTNRVHCYMYLPHRQTFSTALQLCSRSAIWRSGCLGCCWARWRGDGWILTGAREGSRWPPRSRASTFHGRTHASWSVCVRQDFAEARLAPVCVGGSPVTIQDNSTPPRRFHRSASLVEPQERQGSCHALRMAAVLLVVVIAASSAPAA